MARVTSRTSLLGDAQAEGRSPVALPALLTAGDASTGSRVGIQYQVNEEQLPLCGPVLALPPPSPSPLCDCGAEAVWMRRRWLCAHHGRGGCELRLGADDERPTLHACDTLVHPADEVAAAARATAAMLTAAAYGPWNEWAFVGPSSASSCHRAPATHGLGLFARVSLRAGQAICEYAGPRLPISLLARRSLATLPVPCTQTFIDELCENSPFGRSVAPAVYAAPCEVMPNARREVWPTLRTKCTDRVRHRIWLVAVEDIPAGAEIRFDPSSWWPPTPSCSPLPNTTLITKRRRLAPQPAQSDPPPCTSTSELMLPQAAMQTCVAAQPFPSYFYEAHGLERVGKIAWQGVADSELSAARAVKWGAENTKAEGAVVGVGQAAKTHPEGEVVVETVSASVYRDEEEMCETSLAGLWRKRRLSCPPPTPADPIIDRLAQLHSAAMLGSIEDQEALARDDLEREEEQQRVGMARIAWDAPWDGGDARLATLVPLLFGVEPSAESWSAEGSVSSCKPASWSMLATHLPGRSGRECRERWAQLSQARQPARYSPLLIQHPSNFPGATTACNTD
mmetsp:Transcript_21081/g.53955  ORF Transcript_21081/g.53955 Transcript_21081/m.53955 type:complete len:567 (-) Transcript_21081:232-1932(-)